jgi:hypothetical protein
MTNKQNKRLKSLFEKAGMDDLRMQKEIELSNEEREEFTNKFGNMQTVIRTGTPEDGALNRRPSKEEEKVGQNMEKRQSHLYAYVTGEEMAKQPL